MILLQVVFEGISGQELKTDTVNPLLEVTAIWSSAVRIAKGKQISSITFTGAH
jgi:hypothetical protein